MKLSTLLATSAVALLAASAAQAQDTSLPAAYGDHSLSVGFTPDPYSISLTAGGDLAASNVGSSCRGSIARAPDVQLTYSAGNLPLIITGDASSDTTLVVNGPDGQWYCDDDSGDGTNPQLRWNSPRSGVYDIWVGTYGGGTTPARLLISELGSTGGGGTPNTGYPNASLRAAFGETVLNAGFQPDPHRVSLTAGGTIPASNVSSSCSGSIASAPDYQITYTAGSLPLSIRTDSSRDTTLVVNGPDGQWYCDDDSGEGNNARVYFSKPASGTYDIWVGTYSGGTTPATLIVTELD